jgi:hypothetical protein
MLNKEWFRYVVAAAFAFAWAASIWVLVSVL